MFKKSLLVVLLLFSYIVCISVTWTVQEKELKSLRQSIVDLVLVERKAETLQSKLYLDILFAIKNNEIGVVEKLLISQLSHRLKGSVYPEIDAGDIRLGAEIYARAKLYQSQHCSDLCMGIEEK